MLSKPWEPKWLGSSMRAHLAAEAEEVEVAKVLIILGRATECS